MKRDSAAVLGLAEPVLVAEHSSSVMPSCEVSICCIGTVDTLVIADMLTTGSCATPLQVLLDPDAAVLQARLQQRAAAGSHFMPPTLLASQLATLEYTEDELFLHVTSDGLMPGNDEQVDGRGIGQGCRDAEQGHKDATAGASVMTGARNVTQNTYCGSDVQGSDVSCDPGHAGAAAAQDEARYMPVEGLPCDGEGVPSPLGFPTAVDIVEMLLSKLADS